jgi:RNA polymerase sigma factor (sigma-70 family)
MGSHSGQLIKAMHAQERYVRFVLGRYISPGADLDEIVQETYLRLLQIDPNNIKNVKALMLKTARHIAIDQGRHRRRGPPFTPLEHCLGWLTDERGDPERGALADGELQRLNEFIGQLTPREQQVFLSIKVYGYSHQETSERLGIEIHTLEQHIRRIGQHGLTAHATEYSQGR